MLRPVHGSGSYEVPYRSARYCALTWVSPQQLAKAEDALRSHPRASEEEYAGQGHTKKPGPPIAQGGRIGKNRPDRASPL
jgi:hypothetical protein